MFRIITHRCLLAVSLLYTPRWCGGREYPVPATSGLALKAFVLAASDEILPMDGELFNRHKNLP